MNRKLSRAVAAGLVVVGSLVATSNPAAAGGGLIGHNSGTGGSWFFGQHDWNGSAGWGYMLSIGANNGGLAQGNTFAWDRYWPSGTLKTTAWTTAKKSSSGTWFGCASKVGGANGSQSAGNSQCRGFV